MQTLCGEGERAIFAEFHRTHTYIDGAHLYIYICAHIHAYKVIPNLYTDLLMCVQLRRMRRRRRRRPSPVKEGELRPNALHILLACVCVCVFRAQFFGGVPAIERRLSPYSRMWHTYVICNIHIDLPLLILAYKVHNPASSVRAFRRGGKIDVRARALRGHPIECVWLAWQRVPAPNTHTRTHMREYICIRGRAAIFPICSVFFCVCVVRFVQWEMRAHVLYIRLYFASSPPPPFAMSSGWHRLAVRGTGDGGCRKTPASDVRGYL